MGDELTDMLRTGTQQSLRDVKLPEALKVLVLAPHPDDFDAIGVTLRLLHERGHRVEVAVMPTGSGVEDCYLTGASLADKARLREEEQRRSLAFFGLPEERLTFLDLEPDDEDQAADTPRNRERIAEFIAASAPQVVCLPHWNDSNTGHQQMHALLRHAAQVTGLPLTALLNRDPKTIAMRLELYTDFGPAEALWKGKLLRFHDTQQQRNLNTRGHGFDDRILDANRQTAAELGLAAEYAEAFEVECLDG